MIDTGLEVAQSIRISFNGSAASAAPGRSADADQHRARPASRRRPHDQSPPNQLHQSGNSGTERKISFIQRVKGDFNEKTNAETGIA
jgi:hypothetical protein